MFNLTRWLKIQERRGLKSDLGEEEKEKNRKNGEWGWF